MKKLKIKIIKCEFHLNPAASATDRIKVFEDKVNDFLSTLDAEKILKIDYLNSSAKSGRDLTTPFSLLMAIITYFVD